MFVKYFRYYFSGKNFFIWIDYLFLIWFKNFKELEGIVVRWFLLFDIYDFCIEYCKGVLYGNVDVLLCRL